MKDKFQEVYDDILFDTFIRWRSKINEAATHGHNIMEYDSDAADFYRSLAEEVTERARIATAA
jgi:cellulose biosynthesis protein BcsQ